MEVVPDEAKPTKRKPIRDLRVWLALGFGAGLSRFAPGTVGSLWGPVLVWGLTLAGISGWWHIPVAVVLFLVGVPICACGADYFGRKDPGGVVFDEIAPFPLMYVVVPFSLSTAIAGFLLFRFFDIVKFWPIRRFERFPGGWGIMIDDTLAALQAAVVLKLIAHWL